MAYTTNYPGQPWTSRWTGSARPGYPYGAAWRRTGVRQPVSGYRNGVGAQRYGYGTGYRRPYGAGYGYAGSRSPYGTRYGYTGYRSPYGTGYGYAGYRYAGTPQIYSAWARRQPWLYGRGYAGYAPQPSAYEPQAPASAAPGAGPAPQPAGAQWVSWAQSCLAQVVGPWVPQTGRIGRQTRRAIRLFQMKQQLPATGLLDTATVNALQAACSAQAAPAAATVPAPAADDAAAAAAAAAAAPPPEAAPGGDAAPPADAAPPDTGEPPAEPASGELERARRRGFWRRNWARSSGYPQQDQDDDSDDGGSSAGGGYGGYGRYGVYRRDRFPRH